MVEDNEQYAYFSIVGNFDPTEIAVRVGVQPTESWLRGDVCSRTNRERRSSRWALHSRLDGSSKLEDHVQDVLMQLDMNPEAFAALSKEFGGFLQLVAYLRRDYPGLHFDSAITEGLGRYSLAVDFDFYWLYSHQREDTEA